MIQSLIRPGDQLTSNYNSNTWAQQQHMIDSQESQFILQQATDISSSIIGIEDQASFISEDTTGISIMFDFDAVILSSRAYQQARKSHLRQAIRANHHFHSDQTNKDIIPEITVPLRLEDSIASSSDNGSTELLISQPVRDDPIISKAPCSPTEKEQGEEHVQNTKSSALLGHKRSRTLSSPISPNAARLSAQARRLSVRDLFWKTLRQKSDMDIKEVSEGQSARVRSRKVLILGSSESGKSTLFKGLKLALHEGYTTEERLCFNETIWSSILQSARVILGVMESLRIPLGDKRNACHVATILSHSQEFVAPSNDFCQAISALWRDSGFHGAYERRQLYQLHDNACYYARVVHRVLAPDYLPTDKDILSSSTTTTGITMACFPEQRSTVGIGYDFYDVGGARSERRKWVQSSANVSTVLFTIDTTSYARALREDEEDTRMQDQLWLFEGIANNRWFSRSTYILVFTKMDLLRDWLSREPPERYLPDYNYHLSHEGHYMKYLENKFLSLFRSDEVRSRVEILRANLVDVDGENAAKKIVQMLNVQTARYPAMMGCSSISD